MKVIYHAECIDGFTAAWVCWVKYGDAADYVPMRHGDPFDPETCRGHAVIMVDFSMPYAVLEQLYATAGALVVLDHHKTAQAALEGVEYAKFDMERSGAGLAWDELFPGRDRPPLVDYVEDRDLWRFELPFSKEVNARIGCQPMTFEKWDELADMSVAAMRDEGRGALGYLSSYVTKMRPRAQLLSMFGKVVPVVNAPPIGISELVGALAEGHPFAVGWSVDEGGVYRYSLRSRGDVDVSELAKIYGGGGHRNAAGFSTRNPVHRVVP